MTPMLKQYYGVKRQYPDALLFFRMGDFFELFFEDAKVAARILGIALTSRSKEGDMPMAGVPVRSADTYLRRLIQAGQTVVICDQVQDPKEAKGIVERAVTRIVTAGTVLEDALLQSDTHNYLAAVHLVEGEDLVGLSWLDLSTGRFEGISSPRDRLIEEILRLAPAELLLAERFRDLLPPELKSMRDAAGTGPALSWRPDHEFDEVVAKGLLLDHFQVGDLAGFGIDQGDRLVPAAGAVLAYVRETQRGMVDHISRLTRRRDTGAMLLDRPARLALELLETTRDRRREGSLLWCIDRTRTSPGARLLRDWLLAPLTALDEALARQEAVAELHDQDSSREALREELAGVFDIERITARLALQRGSPRDLTQLRDSLHQMPALRGHLEDARAPLLSSLAERLVAPPGLAEFLQRSLVDAPPLTIKDGGVIREGYSEELDELRHLRTDSRSTIAELQAREIQRTGISTLKVGFNSVFGYYLEVTHAHKDRVPEDYVRKQTLKNAERYITPELKDYETRVLRAEDQALALEQRLFEEVRAQAATHLSALQDLAQRIAELDVIQALAEASREHAFHRPTLDESTELDIREGFHPVLAATQGREAFVPNDVLLGGDQARVAIITGPNMAGKSTYLRQTALIVLLAQLGCFVPAHSARIGMVDRIFTRVGASDDLVRGASTFMVEMTETANILHHATARSLVVLDEVGRGTGTFDGLSLARALAEHLSQHTGCRTLFATHYHQLTQLAEEVPGVKNLSVSVKEWGDEIIFLHRIVAGGTDRSYGIHVAQLAGIPGSVLERARAIMTGLEALAPPLTDPAPAKGTQARLFTPPLERILQRLARMDPDTTTPLQALQLLSDLQKEANHLAAGARKRPKDPPGGSLFEAVAGPS